MLDSDKGSVGFEQTH